MGQRIPQRQNRVSGKISLLTGEFIAVPPGRLFYDYNRQNHLNVQVGFPDRTSRNVRFVPGADVASIEFSVFKGISLDLVHLE